MDVPGDREEKSIWVSGGWRYSWNCVSDDSCCFFTGTFLSLSFWIASAKFFYDSVLFATALSIALAVRMGYRGMQDATIFFLTGK